MEVMRHVFQVNGKQSKRGQFKGILCMLRIYTSKNIQKDMDILLCLFEDEITITEVNEPDEYTPKSGKSELAKTKNRICNDRINLYSKAERSLKGGVVVLSNVT